MLWKNIFIAILLLNTSIFFSCSSNPESSLNDAINLYREEKIGSISEIEKEFIILISEKKISSAGSITNGNIIFNQNEGKINILYPIDLSVQVPVSGRIEFININKDYIVFSERKRLIIINKKGKQQNIISIGDGKKSIGALMLAERGVVYYLDHELILYDIDTGKRELLVNNKFKPPYEKYYKVQFYRTGNLFGVITGAAGLYHFSIIDLKEKTILVKDILIASSRLFMNKQHLYCIRGSSGNWRLVKFNISSKSEIVVQAFKDLVDIELTLNGLILEDSSGLRVMDYKDRGIDIPFKYKLWGKCDKKILLEYNDDIYVCTIKKLIKMNEYLKIRIPEIYSKKN